MSTSSLHRLKDRGGGGGGGAKFNSTSTSTTTTTTSKSIKPLTPFSEKSGQRPLQRSSSGKENPPMRCASRPRASSVTRTKPMLVSVPRMDKASAMKGVVSGEGTEARARWSTSSAVPRGRSCSPSQRVLSDTKKGGSRVSIDRVVCDKKDVFDRLSAGKKNSEIGKNGVFVPGLKYVENKKLGSRVMRNGGGSSACLSDTEVKLNEIGSGDKGRVGEGLKVRNGAESRDSVCSSELEMKLDDENGSCDKGRVLEGLEVRNYGEKTRNSVCSSEIEMNLNDEIGTCDRGQVLEKLKARTCVGKGVNLSDSEGSRLNGDVDLRDESWVSDAIDKLGDGSTLNGKAELSKQSGAFGEAKLMSSVGNIIESLKSKESIENINVGLNEKNHLFDDVKVRKISEKSDKLTSKGSRLAGRSGGLKEKAVVDEGKDSNLSARRYPSKLHEKLAFLEGKVKKIASDIKQTKEMLDLNNPDASKLILSNIQEKISGIEKAMGNVVSVGNANVRVLKDDRNDYGKVNESTTQEETRADDGKRSVKGLSAQELEARLFPHQKFLKDRTSLNPSSEMSQIGQSRERELTRNQKQKDDLRSAIDEPIELEFLDSLKNEQSGIPIEEKNEDTENSESASRGNNSTSLSACQNNLDCLLTANEKLEEFDEQEITSRMVFDEDNENSCAYMLKEVSHKIATGGWFVSEGEAVLLAHNDGSCSYYDITNCEAKAEYKLPVGISPNMWQDCWIVPAPNADGCAGRYVVAASAGKSFEAGFCSWDFYAKDVRAFHVEDGTATVRTALADLPNNTMRRRNAISSTMSSEHQQWFYRPCGPLIVSTASCQRSVKVYDIRDGEHVMRWELQKPVATMEYSSPLQWRNKGKVVVAESETISLYDVSSLSPQPLLSVSSSNRKISALHVNNTDAELGGGVRQRVGSSEVEGNDGVFCTADSINVLDFRQPSGIGLKIPRVGVDVQSTFSRGDSVLVGCTSLKSAGKKQFSSQIQEFSLRKQGLSNTYVLPDSNSHAHHKAITQVWGNSDLVMGVCGLGLCVFDSSKDEVLLPYTTDSAQMNNVKDVIGPDDLYYPSFDYLASRVLLISRDRPALWRYLS